MVGTSEPYVQLCRPRCRAGRAAVSGLPNYIPQPAAAGLASQFTDDDPGPDPAPVPVPELEPEPEPEPEPELELELELGAGAGALGTGA